MSAAEELVHEVVQKQPHNIGQIIARLFEIRAEKRVLSAKEKVLDAEQEVLEETLKAKMKEQGEDVTSISSKLGTATITETIVPAVDDWDTFWDWIYENRAFHMLQRRVATNAFRELHEAGQEVPGVRAVPKKDIGLTARA